MQRLPAVFSLRLHGGDFPGDLIGNWIRLAPAYFSIDLDAANSLAAREGGSVLP